MDKQKRLAVGKVAVLVCGAAIYALLYALCVVQGRAWTVDIQYRRG